MKIKVGNERISQDVRRNKSCQQRGAYFKPAKVIKIANNVLFVDVMQPFCCQTQCLPPIPTKHIVPVF